jgi:hypothetical protein
MCLSFRPLRFFEFAGLGWWSQFCWVGWLGVHWPKNALLLVVLCFVRVTGTFWVFKADAMRVDTILNQPYHDVASLLHSGQLGTHTGLDHVPGEFTSRCSKLWTLAGWTSLLQVWVWKLMFACSSCRTGSSLLAQWLDPWDDFDKNNLILKV